MNAKMVVMRVEGMMVMVMLTVVVVVYTPLTKPPHPGINPAILGKILDKTPMQNCKIYGLLNSGAKEVCPQSHSKQVTTILNYWSIRTSIITNSISTLAQLENSQPQS